MATEVKPTIVIVGGAFHTPASYEKLASVLRSSGHEVHVPRLPSTNEARPPNTDLASDTARVRGDVESLVQAGRTVIVIGHSYGGQVCSNALHGLGLKAQSAKGSSGGVSHLIYMAAFALPQGQCIVDRFKEFTDMKAMEVAYDIADDTTSTVRDPTTIFGLSGPGTDKAEVEAYNNSLCRWHGKPMYQPLEHAAWQEIPVVYIHCTADPTIFLADQQSMVQEMEKAGTQVKTYTLETGHCPNLTATREVLGIVNELVSE